MGFQIALRSHVQRSALMLPCASHLRSTPPHTREPGSEIDINGKGVLYGITAAMPVFRMQVSGHFFITASTAGIIVIRNMAVYAGTKFAVRAISEGLRQEAGDKLRVTIISPGFVNANFTESMTSPEIKGQIRESMDKMGLSPDAIGRAMVFAIEQPADVDVGE